MQDLPHFEHYDLRGPERYSRVKSPTTSTLDCETSCTDPCAHPPALPSESRELHLSHPGICVPSARFREDTPSVCAGFLGQECLEISRDSPNSVVTAK